MRHFARMQTLPYLLILPKGRNIFALTDIWANKKLSFYKCNKKLSFGENQRLILTYLLQASEAIFVFLLQTDSWLKSIPKPSFLFLTGICINSTTGDGREYRGQLNYTEKGVMCQPWNERWPHDPEERKLRNPTREGLGKHNYCRNPRGKRARPWCYTTLKRPVWQYCDIVVCNQTLKIGEEDT